MKSAHVKELAKGGTYSFIGLIAARLIGIIFHVLISRSLGAGNYGLFVLGTSIIVFVGKVSSLGIYRGLVRFIASLLAVEEVSSARKIIRISGATLLVTHIITTIALLYCAEFIAVKLSDNGMFADLLIVFILSLPLFGMLSWIAAIVRAFKNVFLAIFIRDIFTSGVRLIITLIILQIGAGLYYVVWSHVVAYLIACFVGLTILAYQVRSVLIDHNLNKEIKVAKRDSIKDLKPTASSLIRISMPLFFSLLILTTLVYTDRFMIAYLIKEPKSVGIYNSASMIAIKINIILAALISIFEPMIAAAYARRNHAEVKTLLTQASWWGFLLTSPLIILFAYNSRLILSIFGPEFTSGIHVLIILIAAQAFNVFTGPLGIMLQMTGHQNPDLIVNSALLMINIALNFFLIPLFGIEGAAIATLCSIIAAHSSRVVLVRYFFKFQPIALKTNLLGLYIFINLLCAYHITLIYGDLALFAVSVASLFAALVTVYLKGLDGVDRSIMVSIKGRILQGKAV